MSESLASISSSRGLPCSGVACSGTNASRSVPGSSGQHQRAGGWTPREAWGSPSSPMDPSGVRHRKAGQLKTGQTVLTPLAEPQRPSLLSSLHLRPLDPLDLDVPWIYRDERLTVTPRCGRHRRGGRAVNGMRRRSTAASGSHVWAWIVRHDELVQRRRLGFLGTLFPLGLHLRQEARTCVGGVAVCCRSWWRAGKLSRAAVRPRVLVADA